MSEIKSDPPQGIPPTIRDVARVASVSLGSVSRVLNGKTTVTSDIRERVENAIRQLGYQPNSMAQSMRSKVSRTVGCIIRDINIPGFAAFVHAAHEVFMEHGYALLLSSSGGRMERERELISVMVTRRADALLIGQYSEADADLEEIMRGVRLPVVLVDREQPGWADAVLVDHRGGVRRTVDKLIQLGHRRIALITGRTTLYPARERILGYKQAHEEHGIPFDPNLIRVGNFEAAFGFEQASLVLTGSDRPTALLAGGIEMLPGILRALRVRGLSIPHDVSVVGALDSDLAQLHEPSISVERWDYAEVGRIAARMALDRITGTASGEPKRILVPTEFILRESCAPPST